MYLLGLVVSGMLRAQVENRVQSLNPEDDGQPAAAEPCFFTKKQIEPKKFLVESSFPWTGNTKFPPHRWIRKEEAVNSDDTGLSASNTQLLLSFGIPKSLSASIISFHSLNQLVIYGN